MIARRTARRRRIGLHEDLQPAAVTSEKQRDKQITPTCKNSGLYSGFAQLWDGLMYIILDKEENTGVAVRIFPRFTIYAVLILVMWSRKNILTERDSWWILHPDEVHQSLEVAHSEVYGFGFRPYEYLPELTPSGVHSNQIDRQREAAGMFSLRSFLLPNIYSLVFRWREFYNIADPPFQVARLFHGVVAGFVPLAAYKLAQTVSRGDRDVAVVSSVLTGFSPILMVLGTHTLVQSLISAPLILLLVVVIRNVQCFSGKDAKGAGEEDIPKGTNEEVHTNNNLVENEEQFTSTETAINGFKHSNKVVVIIVGILIGLIIYVRPDSLVLVITSLLFLPRIQQTRSRFDVLKTFVCLLAGVGLGLAMGGFDDFLRYGQFFFSARQWTAFQLNHAGTVFGAHNSLFYVKNLILRDNLHLSFTCIATFVALSHLCCKINLSEGYAWEETMDAANGLLRLLPMTTLLLLVFSLSPHKELRLVHDVQVVLSITSAIGICALFRYVYTYIVYVINANPSLRRMAKIVLIAELLLYILSSRLQHPKPREGTHLNWTLVGAEDSGYVNQCLDFVGSQSDAKGLLVDHSLHFSGGYTVLHKDIPVIFKTNFEFREWDISSRVELSQSSVSISLIDHVNDFISLENAPLLLKKVLEKHNTYNYVIIPADRKFIKRGFRQVFNASDVLVLRRSRMKADVSYLADVASKIEPIQNGTILLYESEWLIALDLPDIAESRLQMALDAQPNLVRAWQLLLNIYLKTGNKPEAERILKQCYDTLGKDKCTQPTKSTILHSQHALSMWR